MTDIEQFWSTLKSTLGLRASVTEWDPVHATLDGLGPIDGIVDYVTPEFLACAPALACIGSFTGLVARVVVEHHDGIWMIQAVPR